jgi:Tat protein secretion system quality control protein TatD with DNase activity
VHPGLFFSVSSLISTSSSPAKFISILTAIEPHRLLLETDHSNLASVDRLMSDIFQRVKAVGVYREMSELEVIELLERNQTRFLEG